MVSRCGRAATAKRRCLPTATKGAYCPEVDRWEEVHQDYATHHFECWPETYEGVTKVAPRKVAPGMTCFAAG